MDVPGVDLRFAEHRAAGERTRPLGGVAGLVVAGGDVHHLPGVAAARPGDSPQRRLLAVGGDGRAGEVVQGAGGRPGLPGHEGGGERTDGDGLPLDPGFARLRAHGALAGEESGEGGEGRGLGGGFVGRFEGRGGQLRRGRPAVVGERGRGGGEQGRSGERRGDGDTAGGARVTGVAGTPGDGGAVGGGGAVFGGVGVTSGGVHVLTPRSGRASGSRRTRCCSRTRRAKPSCSGRWRATGRPSRPSCWRRRTRR